MTTDGTGPRPRPKRRTSLLGVPIRACGKIALAAASVVAAMGIMEAVLRLTHYRESPLSIKELQAAERNDWRRHHASKDKHFVADPELIWRPKASTGLFNSLGWRGRELGREKKAGEVRVFAIGDSNTLGWDGVRGANWPGYLEELLRQRAPGVVVANGGVYGYSSLQGLRRLREVLPYSPDMILISFGSNDAHLVSTTDADFVAGRGSALSRWRLLRLAGSLRAMTRREGNLVHRVGLDRYKANLREMVSLTRQRGAVAVLLTRPFIGEPCDDPLIWRHYAEEYAQATREAARETGAPMIDLQAWFKNEPKFFSDESHFTEPGHRQAAWLVYREVRRLLVDKGLIEDQGEAPLSDIASPGR